MARGLSFKRRSMPLSRKIAWVFVALAALGIVYFLWVKPVLREWAASARLENLQDYRPFGWAGRWKWDEVQSSGMGDASGLALVNLRWIPENGSEPFLSIERLILPDKDGDTRFYISGRLAFGYRSPLFIRAAKPLAVTFKREQDSSRSLEMPIPPELTLDGPTVKGMRLGSKGGVATLRVSKNGVTKADLQAGSLLLLVPDKLERSFYATELHAALDGKAGAVDGSPLTMQGSVSLQQFAQHLGLVTSDPMNLQAAVEWTGAAFPFHVAGEKGSVKLTRFEAATPLMQLKSVGAWYYKEGGVPSDLNLRVVANRPGIFWLRVRDFLPLEWADEMGLALEKVLGSPLDNALQANLLLQRQGGGAFLLNGTQLVPGSGRPPN